MTRAFSDGYLLAMTEGVRVLSATIRDQTIEESLGRLEPLVESRVKAVGSLTPRTLMELHAKQEEICTKLLRASTEEEKAKYTHYLEALEWMLHADGVHPHQPAAE